MTEWTALLQDLIALRPVSENTERVNLATDTVQAFLQNRGIFCRLETSNGRKILYAAAQPELRPAILLNAHVDVVDAEDSLFHPEIRDGWIHGRGAGDCLGNVVCIVKTLCELKDRASVGAIFSSDEELGGETTGYMVRKGYAAARMVCVLDHWDDDSIGCAQKGTFSVKMTARGKGGHSSVPWRADNPIDKLIDAYCRFRSEWINPDEKNSWRKSMAATILDAGISQTQIPDQAEMRINFRYILPEEKETILTQLKETTGLEIVPLGGCGPMVMPEDAPELRTLAGIMQEALGRFGGFRRLDGATDARWFAPLKVPAAILGIRAEGIHSSREKAEISSIARYSSVLVRLAEKI